MADKKQEPQQENVVISKEVFDGLMERMNRLEKGGVSKPKRITDHEIRIKLIDNKPIVRVGRVVSKNIGTNVETNDLEVYTLEDDGTEKKHLVHYLDFLNGGEHAMARITNQIATEIEEIQGYTRPESFNLNTGQATVGSNEVPLRVTSVTYKLEIEILNGLLTGKKLTIDQSASNI